VYRAGVQAGATHPERSEFPADMTADIDTGPPWRGDPGRGGVRARTLLAGVTLTAWTSVVGYLVAEIFGSLTSLIDDTDLPLQRPRADRDTGDRFKPNLVNGTGLMTACVAVDDCPRISVEGAA
jgi:hypothetical protein